MKNVGIKLTLLTKSITNSFPVISFYMLILKSEKKQIQQISVREWV